MGNIDQVGDQFFSIVIEELQNKKYPECVDIQDAEDETIITISTSIGSSLDAAEALVNILNEE